MDETAEPLPVNAMALIGDRHGIGAEIEVFSADNMNDAYERVLASDVHYRFVIDTLE